MVGAGSITNYGTIRTNQTGSYAAAIRSGSGDSAAQAVTLGAGSTTIGFIETWAGDDSVTLIGGAGESSTTTQTGYIAGGSGTDKLVMKGTGTGTVTGSLMEFESITKSEAGTWNLVNAGTISTTPSILGGTLALSGSTGLSNQFLVNGGTLRAGSAGALGSGVIHAVNGAIQFGATGSYANPVSLEAVAPGAVTLSADTGVVATLSGAITRGGGDGAQPLTVGGLGAIVLGGTANSWSGVTTVNAGATLRGTYQTISGASVVANGALVFDQNGNGSFAQAISGSGTFTKSGSGNLTLSGANGWSGASSVSAGTLTGTISSLAGSNYTVASGATLAIAQANPGTFAKNLSGGGSVQVSGQGAGNAITFSGTNALTIEGQANGHIAIAGGSSVQLSGFRSAVTLTGAGATLDNAGTLSITTTNDTATIYATNPAATITNSGTIGRSGEVAGRAIEATGALTLTNNAGGTIATSLAGETSIRAVGAGQITNYGSITGTTVLAAGGSFTNETGATVNASGVAVYASGALTFVNRGTMSGGAHVVQASSGTITNYASLSGIRTIRIDSGAVTNRGTVTSTAASGVTAAGVSIGSGTFENYGLVTSTDNGVVLEGAGGITNQAGGSISGSNRGVWLNATTGTLSLVNAASATIGSGGVASVDAYASASIDNAGSIDGAANGIVLFRGGTVTNRADALVRASGSGNSAIYVTGGASTQVSNAGTITGAGYAVRNAGGALTFDNSGTIYGGLLVADGGSGAITLAAGSQMTGEINLGNGADTVTVAGTLTGNVAMGDGADGFTLSNGGSVSGAVDGGGGADSLTLDGAVAGSDSLDIGRVPGFETGTKAGTGTWTITGTAANAMDWTVAAGTLKVGGGTAIADASAVSVSSGATLQLLASETVGTLAGGGEVALGGATLTVDGSRSTSFAGTLSGSGGLTKSGSGTLTLTGAGSYTGATSVTAGTLALGASERLANESSLTIGANGTVDLGIYSETVASFTSSGQLNGSGVLTAASYALTGGIVNARLGTGTLTQASGTSTLAGASAAEIVNVDGGTLRLGASDVLSDVATLTVAGGATLDLSGFSDTVGSFTIQGSLTGSGTLSAGEYHLNGGIFDAALGAGRMYVDSGINRLNATSAATLVAIGPASLLLGADNRLNDNADVSVAASGTLDVQGYVDTVQSLSLSGTLAGTGTLTAQNYALSGGTVNANLGAGVLSQTAGTSLLNGTAAAGSVDVQVGTLTLGAANRLVDGAAVSVARGATLNLATYADMVGSLALSGLLGGSGTLTAASYGLQGGTVNANLGRGVLTQAGGTSLLVGTAAAETVRVDAGVLRLGAAERLADGAALDVTGVLDLQGFAETVASASLSGQLSGTGRLTATTYGLRGATIDAQLGGGTLNQLSGTSRINGTAAAGTVAVQAGTLALGAADRLADTAVVSVGAGATLDLGTYSDSVGSLALGGTLRGSGTLTAARYDLTAARVDANLGAGTLRQLAGSSLLNGSAQAASVEIADGTLSLGANERLLDSAAVEVRAGATLDLGAFTETVGTLAAAGTIAGSGTLVAREYRLTDATVNANLGSGMIVQVSGTSALNGRAAVGDVDIAGGTLRLKASDRLSDAAAVNVAAGAVLDLARFSDTVGSLRLAGSLNGSGMLTAGTYRLEGGTVNAMLGGGTLTQLSGTSLINGIVNTGTVTVQGDSLVLGASNRLADAASVSVAAGANLDLGGNSDTVAALALAGTLAGSGTLTAATYDLSTATVNANLGIGTLNQIAGISTLAGTSGAATISVRGGTLQLAAANRFADTAAVTVASGATLDLATFSDRVGSAAIAGTLGGSGTLSANQYELNGATIAANLGAGTLFNTGGASTLTGTSLADLIVVQAGSLALGANERLTNDATFSIAAAGTFDLAGHSETIGALRNGADGGGTLRLSGGRLTLGTGNVESAFSGAITGAGTIDKIGSGRLTLAGDFATTGQINVAGGTLALLGSTKGGVRIQGGTLIGQASVGALALDSGTIAPGGLASGSGQVQPIGSFSASSLDIGGGTLLFDFGGRSLGFAADTIRVTGATTLRGGTVQVTALSGVNDYQFSQRYVLIQSGSLTGSFANGAGFAALTADPSLYWRLRYDVTPNAVVLEVQKQLDFTAGIPTPAAGDESNAGRVGAALSGGAGLASDQWAATLNQIARLTPAERIETYESLSGEAIAHIGTSTATASNVFAALLQQRVGDGGGGPAGGEREARLDDLQAPLHAATGSVRANLLAASRGAAASGGAGRGFWTRIYGGQQNLRGGAGRAATESTAAGAAIGFEARADGWTRGLAGGVTNVGTDVSARGSQVSGTLYQGGAYVGYDDGGAFGSVAVSFYVGDFASQRVLRLGRTPLGTALGKTHSRGGVASLTTGYRQEIGGVEATAIVSLTAARDMRRAFVEDAPGGLGLAVGAATRDTLSATGELRFAKKLRLGAGYALPFFSLGARYQGGERDAQGAMRFSGAPVGLGAFTVDGARQVPLALLWSGGIDARASRTVNLGVAVESAYARRLREARATMRVRIGF